MKLPIEVRKLTPREVSEFGFSSGTLGYATPSKKLKKAIRERMARSGETYSTARMHILAKLKRKKEPNEDHQP